MGSSDRSPGPGELLSDVERERLVTEHLPLVSSIARKIVRFLPAAAELEELESLGRVGLVEASRRFDPTRGIRFKTFVYYRIRGSILDGIRKISGLPGPVRAEAKFLSSTTDLLAEEAEREAGEHGTDNPELLLQRGKETVERLVMARLLSLDAEGAPEVPSLAPGPLEIAEVGEIALLVRRGLAQLDEKERSVVEDYYFNDLTLEAAGAKFGLSKSWTSRLHARALGKLARICGQMGLCPSS